MPCMALILHQLCIKQSHAVLLPANNKTQVQASIGIKQSCQLRMLLIRHQILSRARALMLFKSNHKSVHRQDRRIAQREDPIIASMSGN